MVFLSVSDLPWPPPVLLLVLVFELNNTATVDSTCQLVARRFHESV